MNNQEIELRLKKEVEEATPEVFDKILEGIKKNNSSATIITLKDRKKFPFKALSSLAAAICLVLFGAYFALGSAGNTFKLEVDVNPGILLLVDEKETVKNVELLNEDAKKVVGDMKLKGADMEVALNAIMYSVIDLGYIDEMTNSVLITLDDSKGITTKELTDKIAESVYSPFQSDGLEGSVVVHNTKMDSELQEIAEKYGVTVGKAGLMKHLVDNEKTAYTYEQLSLLSIHELNVLMNELQDLDHVTVKGNASRKAYIGEEKASKTAYSAFGATGADIKPVDCMLEFDNGKMVYEVEFIFKGALYECEVDAITGELLECDMELAKDNAGGFEIPTEPTTAPSTVPSTSAVTTTKPSTEPSKVTTALSKTEIETTTENVPETKAQQAEEVTTEPEETTTAPAKVSEPQKSEEKKNFIGNESAKAIAFSHLGITESDVRDLEVEFDFHGVIVYSVEFDFGGYEYEFEINALTGQIVEIEKDN